MEPFVYGTLSMAPHMGSTDLDSPETILKDQKKLVSAAIDLSEGSPYSIDNESFIFSSEEARRLCQNSLDIICIIDFNGKILWSNQVECKITGFSREELDKRSIMELTHPDDLHKVYDGLKDVAEGILHPCTEVRTLCKDGSYKWISWSGVPILEEGKVYSIGRDITTQKLAESLVADFYSITSHELRTPLSSVRGVLSLLENEVVDPASAEGKELISMARSSCDRLVRLVNDILDLRRIETGAIHLEFETFSPVEIVASALANVKGVAMEARVEIKTELSSRGLIRGDKDRLTQVLTNLLSNGIKYSSSGKTLLIVVDHETTDRVRFSVIDEGPGIPPEQLPKLFKKFAQLDSSDARPKEGIGLGLFVARSIIELHKGNIGLIPSKSGGCHFWFDLSLMEIDLP